MSTGPITLAAFSKRAWNFLTCTKLVPEPVRIFKIFEDTKTYMGNEIYTYRYSTVLWLPITLSQQLILPVNLFFIFIACLSFLEFSPRSPALTLFSVVFLMLWVSAKYKYEDFMRKRENDKTNNMPVLMFDQDSKTWVPSKWRDLKVGKVILVREGESVPCDCIILATSIDKGIAFISTANLDGETNLKRKLADKTLHSMYSQMPNTWQTEEAGKNNFTWDFQDVNVLRDFEKSEVIFEIEPPNASLSTFVGKYKLSEDGQDTNEWIELSNENLVPRGTVVRSTKFIFCVCAYTGYQTKLVLNNNATPTKSSTMTRLLQKILIIQVLVLSAFVIFTTIGAAAARYHHEKTSVYYLTDREIENLYSNTGRFEPLTIGYRIEQFFTFGAINFLLYANILPISLYLAIEILRFLMVYRLSKDKNLYDPETDKYTTCNTSDLLEECAEVTYLFTDKTGTLTKNEMDWVNIWSNGVLYGPVDNQDLLEARKENLANVGFFGDKRVITLLQNRDPIMTSFFECIVICNSVNPVSVEPSALDDFSTVGSKSLTNVSVSTQGGGNGTQKRQQRYEKGMKERSYAAANARYVNKYYQIYQGDSPDEVALAEGCAKNGVVIRARDMTQDTVTVEFPKVGDRTFKLKDEIPFNSDRKRMSVIAEEAGKLTLYSKGADTTMLPLMLDPPAGIDDSILDLSKEGLRVLLTGKKPLTLPEYQSYKDAMSQAEREKDGETRAELIRQTQIKLEQGLTFEGLTAVDDLLMEDCGKTIETLRKAGMTIWVLTGDKQETAVNIGKAIKLFDDTMNIILITQDAVNGIQKNAGKIPARAPTETVRFDHMFSIADSTVPEGIAIPRQDESWWKRTRKKLMFWRRDNGMLKKKKAEEPLNPKLRDFLEMTLLQVTTSDQSVGVAITGSLLEEIFKHRETTSLFLKLSMSPQMKACICARLSPKMKSTIVEQVRQFDCSIVTAAVGDGANDVAMLKTCHVSVGIHGKEGTQAVQESDFATAQFKFLSYIFLHLGRQTNRRIATMILYYIYKNVVLTFLDFCLFLTIGFNMEAAIPDILSTFYNTIFTAFTGAVVFAYDEDIPAFVSLMTPDLYKLGQKNYYLNHRTFWLWFFNGVYHAVAIFFLTVYSFNRITSSEGYHMGFYYTSALVFTVLIFTVTYKLFLVSFYYHIVPLIVCFVTLGFYVGCAFGIGSQTIQHITFNVGYPAMDATLPGTMNQGGLNQVFVTIFSEWQSLIAVLVFPFIILTPDFILAGIMFNFFPNPLTKVQWQYALTRRKHRNMCNCWGLF